MSIKVLINAVDPEEIRIATVQDSKLEGFHIETASREITHGNIYKGSIIRIEPSLQAVFVDYGSERHGFLQQHEIHSDYFQDTRDGDRSTATRPVLNITASDLMRAARQDPLKAGFRLA